MPFPVWLVRATDPGLGVFSDTGVVAVNCLIEEDVTALSPAEMRALLPAGRNGKYAVELAQLLALPTGALVVARDSRREELLVGVVAGPYRHRPGLVAARPHTRDVT